MWAPILGSFLHSPTVFGIWVGKFKQQPLNLFPPSAGEKAPDQRSVGDGPAIKPLCDFEQVAFLLWASVSSAAAMGKDS